MTLPPSDASGPPDLWFDDARRGACFLTAEELRARWELPGLRLSTFDAAATLAFYAWDMARRGRDWPWPSWFREGREDEPSSFEACLWHGDELCGLGHGLGGKDFCALDYVESSPAVGRDHPLGGKVLESIIEAGFVYATILGRPELRVTRPRPHVLRRLQVRYPEAPLARDARGHQYLTIRVPS